MRFRYPSEGTCAGSLLGASSTDRDKTYPSVRLVNLTGKAEVQVCLVMRDAPHRPHPYSLVGRDCEDGIFKQIVVQGRTIVQLINVGIQCVKKAMVQRSAEDKIRKINPFKVSDRVVLRPEEMDLTAVRLCFQAKLLPSNQILPPVLSEIIFDKKATCASQLKITRMNKTYGSVHGGDEVMLFCEKVQKDDIRVIFSLAGWQAEGIFSTGDVHKQVAIVFKTPAFHDQGICAPVKVSIYLWRPSDQQQSNPHSFLYKPELDGARLCHHRLFFSALILDPRGDHFITHLATTSLTIAHLATTHLVAACDLCAPHGVGSAEVAPSLSLSVRNCAS
uniref:Rel-d n=1 Tax=Eudontomyzon morii TaxID=682880 RepID=A0A3G2YQS6_9PETR|nr:Rel-d [Eudontomyzon morii]